MATPKEQHDVRPDAITTGTDQQPASRPAGSAHAAGTFREPASGDEAQRSARRAGEQHDDDSESTPADPSVCSSDEP